jgi:hypothetical protein
VLLWAVKGNFDRKEFFYIGTHLTRKEMIKEHIGDKGREWKDCTAVGDKCVRVRITEL